MIISRLLLIVLFLFSFSVAAQAECDRPWPLNVPDTIESKEELLALQKEVRGYLKNAEEYLTCNEEMQSSLNTSGDEDAVGQKQILVRYYNNTVDEMHYTGERFNRLVRAYKEENSGSEPD